MQKYNLAEYTSSAFNEHKNHWQNVLVSIEEPFVFSGSFEEQKGREVKSRETVQAALPEASWNTISGMVGGNDIGIFVCLSAAVNVLISKYIRAGEITTFIAPFSGNKHLEALMPLHLPVHPEDSLKELLKNCRAVISDHFKYQNFPIEMLEKEYESFSNVGIWYDAISDQHIEHTGITFGFLKGTSNAEIEISYDATLIQPAFAEQLKIHFFRILEAFSTPDVTIKAISILSEGEVRELTEVFTQTGIGYPADKCLHGIFSEKVQLYGDLTALKFGEQTFTYAEVDRISSGFAKQLVDSGVKPGHLVPVIMDRSAEMVMALLAVLKAGGAYVPVDPEYPLDRINYTLTDCEATVLVTDVKNSALEIDFSGTLCVLDLKEADPLVETDFTPVKVQPTEPAYVIYTSGSTGKPKGVVVQHYNVVRLFFTDRPLFDFGAEDVWTMFHSYCFDFSVWEMYGALLFGGTLVVVPKIVAQSTSEYLQLLKDEGVTILNQTPGAFYRLSDQESRSEHQILKVRNVIFGGEALHPVKLKPWKKIYPHCKLINMYGITETTVHVTYKEITAQEIERNISNIGKAIPTLNTYILGVNDELVPKGVPGELCIAGEGVAKGYLNRPELTDERFINNPFGKGKLYKSGDLARYLENGELEYLGRIDHQVKIRGYRIEIGEIENTLLKTEGVKEALVIAGTENEDSFLTAYVVGSKDVNELRTALGEQLPDYMIPTYFVVMDVFPLTPNGKVDRKALPKPTDALVSSVEYVAPTNDIEQTICTLFAETLKIERIGINDNFFELGGHSLKATMLLNRLRSELKVEMSLGDVFKFPTPAGLATLSGERAAVKQFVIPKAEPKEHYHLSAAQRRLFILDQFEKNSTAYNMPILLNIYGTLDLDRLQGAFDQLVERHEALRTTFDLVEGEPAQMIHEPFRLTIETAHVAADQIDEMCDQFVRPFDLTKEVCRVGLLHISDEHHVLMMDMHHIISDGASMEILTREFLSLYSGEAQETLDIQYKDYAEWQHGLYDSGELEKQEAYWIQQFEHDIPVLDFPLDFPRPAIQQFTGAGRNYWIKSDLTIKLRDLARSKGVSMNMLMMAVYNVLLSKYSRQEDIVVGSPTAGRDHEALSKLIGIFINTVAIRNYPKSDKSFSAFLEEVKQSVLGALENQSYQFEELLDKLDVKRDLSRNPLFDMMFTYQNKQEGETSIPELQFEPVESGLKTSKFDMTLAVSEQEEDLLFNLEYATHLFTGETIDRLASHFVRICELVVEDPDQELAGITLVTEDERTMILERFNRTESTYPADKTLVTLFEEQATSTPDKIALFASGETLSYGELNARSNQLARKIIGKGVQKGDVVAIVMHPSLEMFVSIWAVLKSGAAYLPIDPNYPQDRIAYMLENSKAVALMINADFDGFSGVTINAANPELYEGDASDIGTELDWDDLAYVIYTSGSTGNPKGVKIHHEAFLNVTLWNKHFYKIVDTDITTKYSGVGFDASVIEIFPYLISGSMIHIVPDEVRLDAEELNNYFNEHNITISFLPTQIAERFMEFENTSLRCLTTGGDKLKSYKPAQYTLYNTYGPTENAVDATYFKVDKEYANIPIGKPIDNVKAYILDGNNVLQPVGVPGELCISGKSLSKGYLYNDELTAEKFVPNPFLEGQKMYRTGDLVRWLPDGNIEFLGRMDHQVQIRGFRIELGEIENQIAAHPGITEISVLDREDEHGDKFLVAYFVPKEGEELSPTEIRQFVKHNLPEYMIPSYFVALDEMPVTRNGKTDRKKLLSLELGAKANTGVEYVAPESDIEKKLVSIWKAVLGLERIGIKDNFFELGGNSLKIVKVLKMINEAYPESVKIGDLFDRATIEQLAKLIESLEEELSENVEDEDSGFNVVDF